MERFVQHSRRAVRAFPKTNCWSVRLHSTSSQRQASATQQQQQPDPDFLDILEDSLDDASKRRQHHGSLETGYNVEHSDPPVVRLVSGRGVWNRDPEQFHKTSHQPLLGQIAALKSSQVASFMPESTKARIRENLTDPIFLRDCCTCEKCVDPSSGQKHVWTADIPLNIKVKSRVDRAGSMELTWENDVPGFGPEHVTSLKLKDLSDSLLNRVEKRYRTNFTWDRRALQTNLIEVDYEHYMAREDTLDRTLKALSKTGLAIVYGVPDSEQSVVNIAERIGPLRNSFYGMTWDVRSVPNANNVAYTSGHLGFHMDLLYMKEPPRLQFLHCLRSAAEGGASLFVDAFRVVDDIAKEDFHALKLMTELKSPYHYVKHGKSYYDSKPLVELTVPWEQLKTADSIVPHIDCVNWSPMFQGQFNVSDVFSRRDQLGDWLKIAKLFRKHSEKPANIYERYLRPGMAVIFDNRRLLHARTAFAPGDVGKERWLKGCYVDLDPYESRLWQIKKQFWDER